MHTKTKAMKIDVDQKRLEITKRAEKAIRGNILYHHVMLIDAKRLGNQEQVAELTQICEELKLIAGLLQDELFKLNSVMVVNLN